MMGPSVWTTASFCHKWFLSALTFLLVSSGIWGLDRESYARSLESEGDYFRAITVRKELRFAATSNEARTTQSVAILRDFWEARQYREGLQEVTRWQLSDAPKVGSDAERALQDWQGLFLYKQSQFVQSESLWASTHNSLYLGLLYARTGRWDLAQKEWNDLGLPPVRPPENQRSPLIAGILSAVVPGAGQAYSGHLFDATQAFLFVGGLSAAAYGSYMYDSQVSHWYILSGVVGSVAALFYISNIYGASETALYYNQNQEHQYTSYLEDLVFARPLPGLGQLDPKP